MYGIGITNLQHSPKLEAEAWMHLAGRRLLALDTHLADGDQCPGPR